MQWVRIMVYQMNCSSCSNHQCFTPTALGGEKTGGGGTGEGDERALKVGGGVNENQQQKGECWQNE